jgi:hypothetical protein
LRPGLGPPKAPSPRTFRSAVLFYATSPVLRFARAAMDGAPSPGPRMCNLYSITKGQPAIRDLAGAMRDLTGNLPMLPGVFPDYSAPIVRTAVDGVRELAMARWGMPSPTFAIVGKKTDPGVTNIRNVKSSHWRRWLGVESRCIVPLPASLTIRTDT